MPSKLKSAFKVYSIALITSVVMLVMVGLYVYKVIPENKQRLDKEHFNTLYQIREKFDKVNSDLGKQVNINNDSVICTPDTSERFVSLLTDRAFISVGDAAHSTGKAFAFKDYYSSVFKTSDFISMALATERLDTILFFNGEPEPNIVFLKGKTGSFAVDDTILKDLRYYVYSFRPKSCKQRIVLIAGVNLKEFNNKASSFDTTKTLFAILVMLLLFLVAPLLKSVSGSRYEQLGVDDVVMSTSAIGLIAMLVFIILISYAYCCFDSLNNPAEINGKADTLKHRFEQELAEYGTLLQQADTAVKYASCKCNITATQGFLKEYQPLFTDKRLAQKNFTGFFRLNAFGRQVQDETPLGDTIHNWSTSFSQREYFKYQLHANDTTHLYFEPLVSWRDNQFKITVSKGTNPGMSDAPPDCVCVRPVVSALSFTPCSNRLHRLPPDYGFAVIDSSGKVLIHSDSLKNLSENFFDETFHWLWLKKALVFRKEKNLQPDEMYHGQKHDMCLKKIEAYSSFQNFFLIVFKSTLFTESLLRFSVISTFVISLMYVIMIVAFSYLMSAFYFRGHIKAFSMYHFTWLFPNSSYASKYKTLITLDVGVILLIAAINILCNYSLGLFLSFNIGIVTVFLHFLILVKTSPWSFRQQCGLAVTAFASWVVMMILPGHIYLIKALLQLVIFMSYLAFIKSTESPDYAGSAADDNLVQKKYVWFITSSICIHYVFIPVSIFCSIVICENNRATNFISMWALQQAHAGEVTDTTAGKATLAPSYDSYDDMIGQLSFGDRPSNFYLERLGMQQVDATQFSYGNTLSFSSNFYYLAAFFKDGLQKEAISLLLTFIAGLMLVIFLIYMMISIYSFRYFFFDLRAVFDFLRKDKTPIAAELVPPFHNTIGHYILPAEQLTGSINQIDELFDFKNDTVDYPSRLKIANIFIKDMYRDKFTAIWSDTTLSNLEKFVLADLAQDGFVNFKNKDILITLMQKGLVVSDPQTGRIRLMSYAFRQFIRDWSEENKTFFDQEKAVTTESSWARWQLPLIITGATICMFLFYVNRDTNSQIISIGGGILGAITLVIKFIGTYQSILPKPKP